MLTTTPGPTDARQPDGAAEAVLSSTEHVVARLWAELLKSPPVGRNHNFFETGGHSLLAVQMMTRLREEFGVDVPLRVFFDRPTVAALAAHVDALGAGGAVEAL